MKLWNVDYTFEVKSAPNHNGQTFVDGVVVVADSFEEAMNIVETDPEEHQLNIDVFRVEQETKRILTA